MEFFSVKNRRSAWIQSNTVRTSRLPVFPPRPKRTHNGRREDCRPRENIETLSLCAMFDLPLLRQQDILEDYRKRQYQTTASRRQLLVWRRRGGAHLTMAVASSWSKEVGSSHDFPHQWFAIDSLNHRRSNIILFGKMKLIALQNSILSQTQTPNSRRRGEKKCPFALEYISHR